MAHACLALAPQVLVRQMCAPVVRRWMSELSVFSNCCRMKELGVSAAILLAISTAPRMAFAGSAVINHQI